MKKLLMIALVVMLLAACGHTMEEQKEAVYMNITPEQAKQMMENEENYIILDVRTQEEYDEEHIPGAIVIPDSQIADQAESELPDNVTQMPGDLAALAQKARGICMDLFTVYPERVLLHGDVHHDNLLLRSDGSYAVIDPKGVVGPEILDVPRFLLNESDLCSDPDHMDQAISLVSKACGYPREDLQRALFLEAVLAAVWCVEDGIPVEEQWMKLTGRYL